MDVKSVFLNGVLENEINVEQPPSYEIKEQENKVFRFKKALYGIKQTLSGIQELTPYVLEMS